MIKVVPIGYFRELRHGMPSGPVLVDAVNKGDFRGDKQALLEYLRSGLVYAASPGIGIDVLDPSGGVSGSIHALTDGRWIWPADLAFYVEKYDVALPEQFLEDLRSRRWMPPKEGSCDMAEIQVHVL